MRNIILFLFFFSSINSFSQTKKETIEDMVDLFKDQFNEFEYSSIFDTFSTSFQKVMPLEKLSPLLKSIQEEKGDILETKFHKYQFGWASFKTYFEKDSSLLRLEVDRSFNISGLKFSDLAKKSSTKKKEKSFLEIKDTISTINLSKPNTISETVNSITAKTNTTVLEKKSNLRLPFKGEWTLASGIGITSNNINFKNIAQKNAFDFVITDTNGKTFKTDGKTNPDYYAFGKEIIAPVNAKVIMVVDGIPDNDPGILNPIFIPGNTIILQAENKDFLFLSHFKQNSISVKVGESVIKNQLLGLSGNSGNSSEPHLHFHIQNRADMIKGVGIKAFFKDIIVNGTLKNNYSPLKGEIVKNN